MKTIRWRVAAAGAPTALRPCGACGAEAAFASTGQFRVNAQKKRLDVWLVYRCTTCGSVWNCAVTSRRGAKSLDGGLLERFSGNDPELALACALDVSLLKHNGARRGRRRSPSRGPAGTAGIAGWSSKPTARSASGWPTC